MYRARQRGMACPCFELAGAFKEFKQTIQQTIIAILSTND